MTGTESSWQPDRVIYVASNGRRITPAAIEELLAAQARTEPVRPVRRRAAAREAERERVAARDPVPVRIPPRPSADPDPERRGGLFGRPGRQDPRVAALELEVDVLEGEVDAYRRAVGDLRRLGNDLAAVVAADRPSSSALAAWRERFQP